MNRCRISSINGSNGKWTRIESMYFPLSMGLFQQSLCDPLPEGICMARNLDHWYNSCLCIFWQCFEVTEWFFLEGCLMFVFIWNMFFLFFWGGGAYFLISWFWSMKNTHNIFGRRTHCWNRTTFVRHIKCMCIHIFIYKNIGDYTTQSYRDYIQPV